MFRQFAEVGAAAAVVSAGDDHSNTMGKKLTRPACVLPSDESNFASISREIGLICLVQQESL